MTVNRGYITLVFCKIVDAICSLNLSLCTISYRLVKLLENSFEISKGGKIISFGWLVSYRAVRSECRSMRIWPEGFGGGQHDGLRHYGGCLTPVVGGTRCQLLLGTDQVPAGFIHSSLSMRYKAEFYQNAGLPGESLTWKSDCPGRCFSLPEPQQKH